MHSTTHKQQYKCALYHTEMIVQLYIVPHTNNSTSVYCTTRKQQYKCTLYHTETTVTSVHCTTKKQQYHCTLYHTETTVTSVHYTTQRQQLQVCIVALGENSYKCTLYHTETTIHVCIVPHRELINWYFEPSQPQRITSRLKTMFNLSPIYSTRKSSNHKLFKNHEISPVHKLT